MKNTNTFKLPFELISIIGGFGAIQSLFMSLFIFLGRKKSVHNTLLGLLFFFLTVRIVKSVLWLNLEQVPNLVLNIGFIAHALTGPILFLYLKYFLQEKEWRKIEYLHFLPGFGLLLFIFQITEGNFWYIGGYSSLLFHQLAYTLAALALVIYFYFFKKNKPTLPSKLKGIWITILLLGIGSIQLAYFSNYILGLVSYSIAPTIYAFFIFGISLYAVLNQGIFDSVKKYKNINLSAREIDLYLRKIKDLMDSEKPFLSNSFTLKSLAQKISLPLYLTSHLINDGLKMSFSDFTNSYRIEEIKKRLKSREYEHIKIAEIAYDCGFNSISSFNIAFKKFTGITPSAYKKRLSDL